MAMMGFGHTMGAVGTAGALGLAGVGLMSGGAILKGSSKIGSAGSSALGKVGNAVSSFGSKMNSKGNSTVGSNLKMVGDYLQAKSISKRNPIDTNGKVKQGSLSRFGNNMMSAGRESMSQAMSNVIPTRSMYRRRYRRRDE